MHQQALAHDLLHRHARRQGRKRVLEHHLHRAAQGFVGRGARPQAWPATANLPLNGMQAKSRQRQRGLAGTGLPDHTQRRPGNTVKLAPCTATNSPLRNQPRTPAMATG
jgi:hypothetical protein